MKKVTLTIAVFFCFINTFSNDKVDFAKKLTFEFKIQPTDTNNTSWIAIEKELLSFAKVFNSNSISKTSLDEFDATVSLMKQIFNLATEPDSSFSGQIQCYTQESSIEELPIGIIIKFFIYLYDPHAECYQQVIQRSNDFYKYMQEYPNKETVLTTIISYLLDIKKHILNNPTSLHSNICIWYKPN